MLAVGALQCKSFVCHVGKAGEVLSVLSPHQLAAQARFGGFIAAVQAGVATAQVVGPERWRMHEGLQHRAHEACVAQIDQTPEPCRQAIQDTNALRMTLREVLLAAILCSQGHSLDHANDPEEAMHPIEVPGDVQIMAQHRATDMLHDSRHCSRLLCKQSLKMYFAFVERCVYLSISFAGCLYDRRLRSQELIPSCPADSAFSCALTPNIGLWMSPEELIFDGFLEADKACKIIWVY